MTLTPPCAAVPVLDEFVVADVSVTAAADSVAGESVAASVPATSVVVSAPFADAVGNKREAHDVRGGGGGSSRVFTDEEKHAALTDEQELYQNCQKHLKSVASGRAKWYFHELA